MKTAIIFGVTGQDGSYLTELLLEKNYYVVGVARRVSTDNTSRILHLLDHPAFELQLGDITDTFSIYNILSEYSPVAEVYNLAAQSHVGTSFEQPGLTWDVTGKGVLNLLEGVATVTPEAKFYQASSSEMFGDSVTNLHGESFQNENTPFNPQSPYAIAKLAGHHAVRLYRESYGLHASCGILFNHESERRGDKFVTRKITKWIGDNYDSLGENKLDLGNLYAERDWGHARDYVYAMWLMLQQEESDDYVVCTGETHTVEEFLVEAFRCINIWDYKEYVGIDEDLIRPAEVDYLRGDCSKARDVLGWKPKISFEQLVEIMVEFDLGGVLNT
jgi:GDPmannose 4,6-dehydratase